MTDIEPITREEQLLNSIAGEDSSEIEPITRQEMYLSAIAGESDLPTGMEPITREEIYYQKILDNGGAGGSGDEPTGTIQITSNGTHNVKQYASANVQVPNQSTGTKQISITQNGTTTEDVSAYANAQITVNVPSSDGITADTIATSGLTGAVELKTTTTIRTNAFTAQRLSSCSSTSVTRLSEYSFRDCAQMASVNFPNVTTIGTSAFNGCRALVNIVLPKCTSIGASAFGNCSELTGADFPVATSIGASAFAPSAKLNTLVLRKTDGVCSLANTNAFTNSPFASGREGGTLYVPSALIDDYKATARWSTILGYETNTILPIEGSEYENTYVDGTPII